MKIKIGFLVVLASLGCWLGFRAGYNPNSSVNVAIHNQTTIPTNNDSATETNPALAAAKQIESAPQSKASASVAYDAIIGKHKLDKKHADFSRYFSNTASGQAFTQLGVLYIFSDTYGAESKLFHDAIQVIEARPVEAIADLREAFKELPDDYARERQLLIQIASRLDVDPNTKFEILKNELERPMLTSKGAAVADSFYTPAVALDSLLEMTQDTASIETVLRTGLRQKKSKEAQDLLISRFAIVDQNRAAQLRQEFGL